MSLGVATEVSQFNELPVFKGTTFLVFDQDGDDVSIAVVDDYCDGALVWQFAVVDSGVSKFLSCDVSGLLFVQISD